MLEVQFVSYTLDEARNNHLALDDTRFIIFR
jgi:hypothetical protein